MEKKSKKIFLIFYFLIITISNLICQNYQIDYYGIVCNQIDSNMSKMTSDLYYTQLSEITSFTVTDKRKDSSLSIAPDVSTLSDEKLSFYTEIKKNETTDTWLTTFYVIDKKNQEQHSKQKEYDSFYKILMESKNVLKETIKQLIENEGTSSSISLTKQNSSLNNSSRQTNLNNISTENLSGTWVGEEFIDKIVILRGGRGFAIFKNGASMNISVEILSDNTIKITQKGKGNASFYPELPRNTALNAAISAPPIEWNLQIINATNLSGTKKTLLPDGEDYIIGTVTSNWNRIE